MSVPRFNEDHLHMFDLGLSRVLPQTVLKWIVARNESTEMLQHIDQLFVNLDSPLYNEYIHNLYDPEFSETSIQAIQEWAEECAMSFDGKFYI